MKYISILALVTLVAGCQENLVRSDLIEPSSGNAIQSSNTLQTIDPWQRYVYDTDLETSSLRQSIAREKYENGGKLPKKEASAGPVPLYPFPYPPADPNQSAADNLPQDQ